MESRYIEAYGEEKGQAMSEAWYKLEEEVEEAETNKDFSYDKLDSKANIKFWCNLNKALKKRPKI